MGENYNQFQPRLSVQLGHYMKSAIVIKSSSPRGVASAFGRLVKDRLGPIGPILDLTHIPCRFSLFLVLKAFNTESNGTREPTQGSHPGHSGHYWKDPGVEFLNLGPGLAREQVVQNFGILERSGSDHDKIWWGTVGETHALVQERAHGRPECSGH